MFSYVPILMEFPTLQPPSNIVSEPISQREGKGREGEGAKVKNFTCFLKGGCILQSNLFRYVPSPMGRFLDVIPGYYSVRSCFRMFATVEV